MEDFKENDELYFYFQKYLQFKEKRMSKTKSETSGEMEHLAYYDVLTQLKNRRAFEKDAEEMGMKKIPFWIISMDANNLKKVNDTYGHQQGDEFLKEIADTMRETFGKESCYRFGGDEFAVILADKNEEELLKLTEDFKKKLQCKKVAGVPISVSAGFAICLDGMYGEAFEEADRQMYLDKENFKENLQKKKHTKKKKEAYHISVTYELREIVMFYLLAVLAVILLN